MDFHSLVENVRSETAYSQVFIHFSVHQPVWMILQQVEELGGELVSLEVRSSNRPDHRICMIRLENATIQDVVIALTETGMFEVQGIGRRTN